MTVPEGHFRLYASMRPHLTAGSYRFRSSQPMTARTQSGAQQSASQLPVDSLTTHVEVTSPRYQLPPDQILSTYPPAGSEGAYGSRLPQIVIKRRTLPWERDVVPGTPGPTPWLALVVVTEHEADLVLNQPVAQCATPGVTLPGAPDVSTGNYLQVRRSVIDSILPTRKDVPLLAHVREVDISDTELMMGDDDGFVAVVVANRLPLAARSPEGDEAPVKYLAALISLEGQLTSLLPEAPAPQDRTSDLISILRTPLRAAQMDQAVMFGAADVVNPVDTITGLTGLSGIANLADLPDDEVRIRPRATTNLIAYETAVLSTDSVTSAYSPSGGWPTQEILSSEAARYELATDFIHGGVLAELFAEARYRFPVLAHWSFTSVGDTTFESLMTDLDSGLLGTPPSGPPPAGRAPLTVVETGHIELPHRTRHGDLTSAWYRGPLSPHPTDTTAARLPLAHAADQLRIVVPDGREDLSLASAFEIGRLMALAHPSLVDSLLRWRQQRFQIARGRSLLEAAVDLQLGDLRIERLRDLPHRLGMLISRPIVNDPEDLIGTPLELLTPGTDMRIMERLSLGSVTLPESLATGLAIDADLAVSPGAALGMVLEHQVHRVTDLDPRVTTGMISGALHDILDVSVTTFAASTLGAEVADQWLAGRDVWEGIDLEFIGTQLQDLGGIDIGRGGFHLDGPGGIIRDGPGGIIRNGPGSVIRDGVNGPLVRPRDALDDLVDRSGDES